jgi:DMSO/TMAO reductase YedYZ molybdopterin-dependent catalytic subunit
MAIVPLLVLHVILRWPRPRRADFTGRRAVLRQMGLVGAGAAGWLAVESATRVLALPGADRRFTGSFEEGSYSGNAHPVTNWLTDTRQHIDAATWRLRLAGLDGPVRELSYQELLQSDDEVEEALLDCTGGWYTIQHWRGVRVATLLATLEGQREAASVVVRGATGYERRFALGKAADLLLATHVEDQPLSASHGFPVRLVAPGHRGFHWVKWVTEISLSERPAWWQPPFPLQ